MMSDYLFKIANEPDERRQIRALNYRTFVEEIPQHSPNQEHSLPDRFEKESTTFICKTGDEVIGMVALRCNRPFSLDGKLPKLDAYLPPHRSSCEIRLLAVEPKHRKGRILAGLVSLIYQFCSARGHDLVLISGTTRQIKLYEHMGFTAFGPLVGTPGAQYQPMYQFVERFRNRVTDLESAAFAGVARPDVNLMPGPIYLATAVQAALGAKPVSHRAEAFEQLLERTRGMLCELTGAPEVVIATGSGTLANDLVAGQLAQYSGRGVILSNGEFGRRLVDHAERLQLDFQTVEAPWGEAFDEREIRRALDEGAPKAWLWAVHAETSTGVLNDLALLKRLSGERHVPLCLDCVSALGVVPCDLRGVALASGVSGKGLRSIAGLALVFHDGPLPPPVRVLPRYLDLWLYLAPGVPFTLSSSLLAALSVAVETLTPETRFSDTRETSEWLCRKLLEVGIKPLAAEAIRFPGAITLPVPQRLNACALGQALSRDGWLLSFQSNYLRERNWIQICLLGHSERAELEPLPGLLATLFNTEIR